MIPEGGAGLLGQGQLLAVIITSFLSVSTFIAGQYPYSKTTANDSVPVWLRAQGREVITYLSHRAAYWLGWNWNSGFSTPSCLLLHQPGLPMALWRLPASLTPIGPIAQAGTTKGCAWAAQTKSSELGHQVHS